MIFRITLILLSLAICFSIPIFYQELLEFSVTNLHAGWVFSTIYLRVIVIIFFAIALNLVFSYFAKTRKLKFWIVFLIALLPGFGISFIAPIYQGDYGFNENSSPPDLDLEQLKMETSNEFNISNKYQLIAFFSLSCPHCMNLSSKLGTNLSAGQDVPVHSFFAGPEENRDIFIDLFHGEEFSSYVISDSTFLKQAGGAFPSTYLIDQDGKIIHHWFGDVINYSVLDYLLDLE